MNSPSSDSLPSLMKLATFLVARQDSILDNWRIACNQDPLLDKVATLTQLEFNDALPMVLTILHQRLLGQLEEGNITQLAIAHGLQRRLKAHLIVETVRELNHLTQALYNELTGFQDLHPHTDPKLLWQVQRQMTLIMAQVIDGSIQIYDELQRSEAASRAVTLQKAIDQMIILSDEKNDRLRASMHDLRGGFSIINGAAGMLKMDGISEQEQTDFLGVLNRNLTSVQAMLTNLMDLSRLEAGQETRQIQTVDTAQLLKIIALSVQPIADQRGLALRMDGPRSLLVKTDPIKLQRIVQNLLLNALKYTATGFIAISWIKQDTKQWMLCIQDSGPGLPTAIARQLMDQTEPAVKPTDKASESDPMTSRAAGEPAMNGVSGQAPNELFQGEGLGLQIVKQFSQLLSARIEIETTLGQGTSFRLWFPIHYPASA